MQSFVFGPLINELGGMQNMDPLSRLCMGEHALFFTGTQQPLEVLENQFLEALEICAEAAVRQNDEPQQAEPNIPKVLFVRPGAANRPRIAETDLSDPAAWCCCFKDLPRGK